MTTNSIAEAKRRERNLAKKVASEKGYTTTLSDATPLWSLHAATAPNASLNMTTTLADQITTPFPGNPKAPEPRSIICPTHKAGIVPYSRPDAAVPPAVQDKPRRRRGAPPPKESILGPGFSNTITSTMSSTSSTSPTKSTTPNIFQGTVTAEAFAIETDTNITQPDRFYRPYQSTDQAYISQW
eukprot:m.7644 g.7644  ORF g.7644 m.7644 type:complete len:184 (-) comp2464_c0_seq1:108-659(-)